MLLNSQGDLTGEIHPLSRELPYDLMFFSTFNPEKQEDPYPEFCITTFLDILPTPSSDFTSNKTTRRDHYNSARERAGIKSRQEQKEVILYNEQEEITEGSVCNVAFWRDGCWTTPSIATGCLPGTVRRWLIEQQRLKEGSISKQDVCDGEYVLLTNGANGVQLGKIALRIAQLTHVIGPGANAGVCVDDDIM